MQAITRSEFLELLGLTSGAFAQLQHAGHVALAFGTPLPATQGRYLDLDLVAMAISLGLAQSIGRDAATAIVGGFFHQWAAAVGHAEADLGTEFFLAVGGVGWDTPRKSPKQLVVTHGSLKEISDDFAGVKDLVGFFTVNVSDIIRRLRKRATAAGIDLSRPFFFLPDDPRVDEIIARVKRELAGRIARLRRNKKKLAVVKARRHRRDIAALPRVVQNNYPVKLEAV